MKWNRIYSYEIHEKFIWTSYGVQMNFSWISYEMKSYIFIWMYMQFVWSSYELHIEGLMKLLYPCNTNEVDTRLINSSHEVHIKLMWILNDLNFIWTSCELHKNYMTSAQEVPLYYTWIWFLASLLCTSYEWASRSIVESLYVGVIYSTLLWCPE